MALQSKAPSTSRATAGDVGQRITRLAFADGQLCGVTADETLRCTDADTLNYEASSEHGESWMFDFSERTDRTYVNMTRPPK